MNFSWNTLRTTRVYINFMSLLNVLFSNDKYTTQASLSLMFYVKRSLYEYMRQELI